MRLAVHLPLLLALIVAASADCGSSKLTNPTDAGNPGTAGFLVDGFGSGDNFAGNGGTDATGGFAGTGDPPDGGFAGAPVDGGFICGAMTTLQPIVPDVLILLDNSASMNDDAGGSTCPGGCGASSKWTQVTTAIEDVVMSTQASVNWGLQFMGSNSTCGVPPGVAVGVLPSASDAISTALALVHPLGDTPTELAMDSAVTYLQGRTDPNSKYILLATDGLPTCKPDGGVNDDDSAGAEAAVAAARTAGFDTFVVGFATSQGTANATLDAMAVAGGEPTPPGSDTSYYLAADTATLEAALTTIAANAKPCSFALPPASSGRLVISGVGSSGNPTMILAGGANGWAYAADMKSVALSGFACARSRSGLYASIVASYCSP